MAIALACPGCANTVTVTPDMAGKHARCGQCRMELALPAALIELPSSEAPDPRELPRPAEPGSLIKWVLAIGALALLPIVLVGGTVAVAYYLWHSEDEAARLAGEVVVKPAGVDLPPGVPVSAMRVTEFDGVFQIKSQLINTDVVFRNQPGGVNKSRVSKEYVIDLEAGRDYIIDLEAPQFDAYLRLAHLNGMAIMEDDDSGGGLNSRIRFRPGATGSYLVVATSLGGGVGPFTLTVRESRYRKPK